MNIDFSPEQEVLLGQLKEHYIKSTSGESLKHLIDMEIASLIKREINRIWNESRTNCFDEVICNIIVDYVDNKIDRRKIHKYIDRCIIQQYDDID